MSRLSMCVTDLHSWKDHLIDKYSAACEEFVGCDRNDNISRRHNVYVLPPGSLCEVCGRFAGRPRNPPEIAIARAEKRRSLIVRLDRLGNIRFRHELSPMPFAASEPKGADLGHVARG